VVLYTFDLIEHDGDDLCSLSLYKARCSITACNGEARTASYETEKRDHPASLD
jgi:hypothetical protein